MPRTTPTKKKPRTKARQRASKRVPTVISMGCPSGIGPEISLQAALGCENCVIVGDRPSIEAAGETLGVGERALSELEDFDGAVAPAGGAEAPRGPRILQVGEPLRARERRPGKPSAAGGAAQLAYIEQAFFLAKERGWPMVTGPVSKEAIAHCGLARARRFRGHTEWLERLDGADHSVMCFASPRLVTSLATTHVPLSRVSRLLSPELVSRATLELAHLLLRLGVEQPLIAVCSFNPHAGEGELLGKEENRAIVPGIRDARRRLRKKARLFGPVGAETAYRKGAEGGFHGVVGIYHDQATIAMKLLDFGGAVNVTQGLSIVRTSVDHGTAYDIAGQGLASPTGMLAAKQLAERLSG